MNTEKINLQVEGKEMGCFVARPEGVPKAGLLVFQEAFGVNAHIRDVTERFAKEGYLAIAPELFHRSARGFESEYVEKKGVAEQMGALTDEGLLADTTAVYTWLLEQGIAREHIGAIGYCMGGRTAFLANASLPLACAVSYYGGRIAPSLLPLASQSHGPLLLIWGGLDAHIPKEQRDAVAEALSSAGKPFESVVYEQGDHGFFCDARASYNKEEAGKAWLKTLDFLGSYLS